MFHPEYTALYERKPTAIPALGIRIQEHIALANINLNNIKTSKLLNFPPWQMVKPTVNLDLTKCTKSTTNQLVYQQYFAELKTQYPEHVSIYTYGSKDGVIVKVDSHGSIGRTTDRIAPCECTFDATNRRIARNPAVVRPIE